MTELMDVVFCVDATGSMGSTIEAAKKKCISIAEKVKENNQDMNIQYGAVFYRDPVDSRSDTNEFFRLSENVEELQNWISTQNATGGGDMPEDWVGAFRLVLNDVGLRENSIKLVIVFADAPAHGKVFCGSVNHEDQTPLLINLIHQFIEKGIDIQGLSVSGGANATFDQIKDIYNSLNKETGTPSCGYEVFNAPNAVPTYSLGSRPPPPCIRCAAPMRSSPERLRVYKKSKPSSEYLESESILDTESLPMVEKSMMMESFDSPSSIPSETYENKFEEFTKESINKSILRRRNKK